MKRTKFNAIWLLLTSKRWEVHTEKNHIHCNDRENAWRCYLDMKKQLRNTVDNSDKEILMNRILEIGEKYWF